LEQLTIDHTWVQRQVDEGKLKPAEARLHPLSNVLTRVLGTPENDPADVIITDTETDDVILLCSDGLTAMLEDAELHAILMRDAPLGDVGDALVEEANRRGGVDNVTVVLLRAVDGKV